MLCNIASCYMYHETSIPVHYFWHAVHISGEGMWAVVKRVSSMVSDAQLILSHVTNIISRLQQLPQCHYKACCMYDIQAVQLTCSDSSLFMLSVLCCRP